MWMLNTSILYLRSFFYIINNVEYASNRIQIVELAQQDLEEKI